MPLMHQLCVISAEDYVAAAQAHGITLSADQDPLHEDDEPSPKHYCLTWGDCALIYLREYQLKGKTILWAPDGPIWFADPSASKEAALLDALQQFAVSQTKAVALRLHTRHSHDEEYPAYGDEQVWERLPAKDYPLRPWYRFLRWRTGLIDVFREPPASTSHTTNE